MRHGGPGTVARPSPPEIHDFVTKMKLKCVVHLCIIKGIIPAYLGKLKINAPPGAFEVYYYEFQ